jgi:hypothetical protein
LAKEGSRKQQQQVSSSPTSSSIHLSLSDQLLYALGISENVKKPAKMAVDDDREELPNANLLVNLNIKWVGYGRPTVRK